MRCCILVTCIAGPRAVGKSSSHVGVGGRVGSGSDGGSEFSKGELWFHMSVELCIIIAELALMWLSVPIKCWYLYNLIIALLK